MTGFRRAHNLRTAFETQDAISSSTGSTWANILLVPAKLEQNKQEQVHQEACTRSMSTKGMES